ncbi:MAG: hypothetical protein GY794_24805, partial [bacterium]|nr:hypothetical protein [bacterium]
MKHRTSKISDRTVHPSEKATDLTGRQLSHLEQLATSKNCIPHPSFELSCTEEELFGSDAPEVRVNAWSNFPELPGDIPPRHQGHTPLRSEDEVRLFLRYNYARYRLASLARMPGKKSSPIRIAEMYGWYQRAMRLRSDLT